VKEENKKSLGFTLAIIFLATLATPMVLAKPGAEKSNSKFEYFYLEVSGLNDGSYDRRWWTPPNVDEPDSKTIHARGGGWLTYPGANLTVGEEEFRMDTAPYNITWTTTFDNNAVRFNNGTTKSNILKLHDVVTVYDANNVSIGTLVLELKSSIKLGVGGGNIMGYGTGELKGVHISAIDLSVTYMDLGAQPPIVLYGREGTITGWPDYITNP
jgi:hypothetical protein